MMNTYVRPGQGRKDPNKLQLSRSALIFRLPQRELIRPIVNPEQGSCYCRSDYPFILPIQDSMTKVLTRGNSPGAIQ